MNGVLKASARTVSKSLLYRTAGSVAFASVVIALAISWAVHPSLSAVLGFFVWPFLAVVLVWAVAGLSRLRLVGFLPGEANDDDFIPRIMQPWIRFWLLSRIGLLIGVPVLLIAAVATGITGHAANSCVDALIYLVVVRLFMDLAFGAAFNFGIVARRCRAG